MEHLPYEYERDTVITDTEYVEELIGNILYIETASVSKIQTFHEAGLASSGRGFVVTLNDGGKYHLSIAPML